jgi:hypothetical protein
MLLFPVSFRRYLILPGQQCSPGGIPLSQYLGKVENVVNIFVQFVNNVP